MITLVAKDQGNRTTPFYVAFTDTEHLIGDTAKNQGAMNPLNTVFDAKRLIAPRAVLHHEMSFVLLTEFLNVTAVEESTSKSSKITITNDMNRLSRDEIERMVNDAEHYRTKNEKQREKISAKNALESYCFYMKQTIEGENMKNKISDGDCSTVLDIYNETLKWLDANQLAEV
ncbi:hypothetical protein QYM36_004115 [Artemia franciscana]|uniref:Heat shock protein 70 n=1 Tax=Artemia franciscana TaxID=6661 RepID=A0AA88LBH5_ARTSF|nr:hypothetical protein QYM36_004115 [Artemia franciscana]